MNFEWDDAKRLTSISKHGFDFEGVEEVFEGRTITILDNRFDYGENRFLTLGVLRGWVVAIAHTESDSLIRIISVRKADANEEEIYYKEIADGLETD